ncbi:MAG: oxygenase MpaB family protein [Bacteroidota bacterium]
MNLKPSENWTNEFLNSKRQVTDPLADEVVRSIMQGHEKPEVNHLFQSIVGDDDQLPDSAPQEIKDYFQTTSILPEWADADLIKLGQQVYIRHGVWISLLLTFKSLPECYACAKGAEVLYRTGRLNEHHGSLNTFSRRIAETAQFVFYSMKPNGLFSQGRGLRATQKVRLIHAVIRYYLKREGWDANEYDEPINQEDMTGTLMAFSALILEGFETLGVTLSEVEKEAYIHCWRVIGHIVGMQEELIPDNYADALDLGHTILNDQTEESEQGKVLMAALLDFTESLSKLFFSKKTNILMMRLMMGDELSDLLAVPEANDEDIRKLQNRLRLIARIAQWLDKSLVMAMVTQFFAQIMLQISINYLTKSSVINFYLPKSLTKDWGVKQDQ